MATAIISDKFRIFNATQFLESLNEGTGGEPVADRTNMFFFVGRPWVWNATVEIFNVSGGAFTPGLQVYVGANFGAATFVGTIEEVTERSLILSNIGPNSLSTPLVNSGDGVLKEYDAGTTSDTGVTALAGEYNYGNESVPQQAVDHQTYRYQIDDDMIAAKRITKTVGQPGFARNVVARYNWVTGRTWDMYRPDYAATPNTGGNPDQGFVGRSPAVAGSTDLSDAEFYVMTSNYEVFKCIYNSEDTLTGIATSTVEPLQTSVDANGIHNTGDGYLWKYMYTIGTTDVLRFLSTDFLPVNLAGEATRNSTEGLAVDGGVYVVSSTTPGASVIIPGLNGTFYAPVNGDGQLSGAIAVVEIEVTGGTVTSYSMIDGNALVGNGYTYGSISLTNGTGTGVTARGLFDDATLNTPTAAVTGPATGGLEPIMSPPGGHGANMEYELNSKRVMTNIRLTYAEGDGDFPVDNDFRRIGLLQDPVDTATTQRAILDTYSTLKALKITAATDNFQVDNDFEQVQAGGTAKGRVVSWVLDDGQTVAPYDGTLKYFQSPDLHTDSGIVYEFEQPTNVSQTVGGITTTASVDTFTGTSQGASFSNGLAERELVENSGEVIYVENRRLITRAPDQIEDIKLVIEF